MGDPLDMLAEECAEVIQAIMKYRRFAAAAVDPQHREALRLEIVQEIADVLAVLEMIRHDVDGLVFTDREINVAMQRKADKLQRIFGNTQ